MLKSLEELVNIIRDRKNSNPEKSYTSKLLNDKKMNVAKVKEEVKELSQYVVIDSVVRNAKIEQNGDKK